MAEFMDRLENSFFNGLDRWVDSETREAPQLADDRTYITRDSGTPTVPSGTSSTDYGLKAVTSNPTMLIVLGVAVLGVVFALKR